MGANPWILLVIHTSFKVRFELKLIVLVLGYKKLYCMRLMKKDLWKVQLKPRRIEGHQEGICWVGGAMSISPVGPISCPFFLPRSLSHCSPSFLPPPLNLCPILISAPLVSTILHLQRLTSHTHTHTTHIHTKGVLFFSLVR